MNSLDLTMVIIMGVAVTVSTFRGAIRELFSLAAVLAGFLLAAHYSHYAADGFLRLTTHQEVNNIIAFLAVFIITAALISFIGGRVSSVAKKSGLDFWDHMIGTGIGTVKGIIACTLVVYALLVFLPAKSPTFVNSMAFPFAAKTASVFSPIAPKFFRDEFDKKIKEFNSKTTPKPTATKKPEPEKTSK